MSIDNKDISTSLPRVLVLMATYNGAAWIMEQLTSILEQRGVTVFIHVSDDLSHDNTVEIVHLLGNRHKNLTLQVRSIPSGSAGANFRELLAKVNISNFDFVALADQDDIWDRDHLLRGCQALIADRSAGGWSCAVQTFGFGASIKLTQCPRLRNLDFLFEGAGQGCTFVLTRETAQRVQQLCKRHPTLTSELHYHDWLIYIVVRCCGDTWIFDAHASLHYRQHSSNEIGARSRMGSFNRRWLLIRQGWYRQQVDAALSIAMILTLNHSAELLQNFKRIWQTPSSRARKVRLALLLAREGRRKYLDRLILVASVLRGHL